MNEALIITQIVEKDSRSYAFLIPYGAPWEDVFTILEQFIADNKQKQVDQLKAHEEQVAAKALELDKSQPKGVSAQ